MLLIFLSSQASAKENQLNKDTKNSLRDSFVVNVRTKVKLGYFPRSSGCFYESNISSKHFAKRNS